MRGKFKGKNKVWGGRLLKLGGNSRETRIKFGKIIFWNCGGKFKGKSPVHQLFLLSHNPSRNSTLIASRTFDRFVFSSPNKMVCTKCWMKKKNDILLKIVSHRSETARWLPINIRKLCSETSEFPISETFDLWVHKRNTRGNWVFTDFPKC